MAGIVFWFQEYDTDVFSGRPIDLDAWRYAIKAGNIQEVKCVNETEEPISIGDTNMDFEIIGSNFEDFTNWISDHSNIAIFDTEWTCPEGAIPLSELNHSDIDWYVFGSADLGVPKNINAQYVYLPISGTGALHSVHIASAVMLRRWENI